ncbi:MAG TPA: hypothetical protein PKE26_00025 [Kiritimatiellia bacterium]|nr:hypothetical protein [Kiritimatiellia bacterium]HMO97480.1 hypothetical protein [Kiritimatiellia bacterium]HMP96289.1 hypothetical protein [Kiritimatiellia bacterium]
MVTILKCAVAAALVGLSVSGCAGSGRSGPVASGVTAPPPRLADQYGQVVRVNRMERYVVLECAVLPKPGDRFTVYDGIERTGVVRIGTWRSGRFAIAEVEEGYPQPGNWFRSEADTPER